MTELMATPVRTTSPVTEHLVDLAWSTQFDELTPEAITAAKHVVLDTLTCVVAGISEQSGDIVRQVWATTSGTGEATVALTGERVPLLNAVYVNSHAANVLDADDTVRYRGHVGAATVPAALAVAEREGSCGRDLLGAVAIGYEAATRVGLSMEILVQAEDGAVQFAPVSTHSWTGVGACVAAGRLLGITPQAMRHALGITGSTIPLPASTIFGTSLPRPMTKYVMYGPTAQAGVAASLLAQRGFTGEPAVLDGERGLWKMLGSLGSSSEWIVRGAGDRWLIEDACFKVYPACRFNAGALDLFTGILDEHDLAPEDIESVVVRVPAAGLDKHRAGRAEVESLVDAGFSLPHLIAAAAHAGRPGPRWVNQETRTDSAVRAFAQRVAVEPEPRAVALAREDLATHGYLVRMPTTVTVRTASTDIERTTDRARGDAHEPGLAFSLEDHVQKFHNFCGGLLEAGQIERVIELVLRMEELDSVDELMANLVARQR